MRSITLFYDGAWYTFKWFKTMLWAKEEFRELGYDVKFLNEEEYAPSKDKAETFEKNALNNEYDIVFLAHSPNYKCLCSLANEKFAEVMEKLRRQCNKIVYFDTADSTGTMWTNAFPFVDLYFKKQVIADLKEYTQRMWGGRPYTQYYLDNGYIERTVDYSSTAVKDEDIKKIRISWNVGLGELFEQQEISYQNPYHIFTPESVTPSLDRKYDVHYKGSLDYSMCGYQRLKSTELIAESKLKHSDVFTKIPYNKYLQEIADSKAVVSPYGYGEICTRDFEAFVQGAVLIKPNMSHLKTYPDWYVENQTYVPTKWDFSDFMEVIERAEYSKEYIEIAQNAQNLFHHHRKTKEGKREFAKHIIQELER